MTPTEKQILVKAFNILLKTIDKMEQSKTQKQQEEIINIIFENLSQVWHYPFHIFRSRFRKMPMAYDRMKTFYVIHQITNYPINVIHRATGGNTRLNGGGNRVAFSIREIKDRMTVEPQLITEINELKLRALNLLKYLNIKL